MNQLRGSGPLQTATQTLKKQLNYNSPSLHDAIRNACHDVNIGPLPDLPKIGKVRCPGIDKKPSNRSGWINIKTECAHIVDHSSGFTLTVFADKPRSHADVRKFKRKQAQAKAIRQAKQDASQESTALTVATTWSEATDAPVVSGYMANKGQDQQITGYGKMAIQKTAQQALSWAKTNEHHQSRRYLLVLLFASRMSGKKIAG